MSDAPFVQSVMHPSDFSESSQAAFDHALAISLYRQADLSILHVVSQDRAVDDWSTSPAVRGTLERWGVLEAGSTRAAVWDKLAIDVAKINIRSSNPTKAIVNEIEKQQPDVVVLATEGRVGLPRWLAPSVAEGVARRSRTMTLFVPTGAPGFVSPDDGRVALRRVLVPVDRRPSPAAAVAYAARAAVASHEDAVELTLLHVGDAADWPDIDPPQLTTCTWSRMDKSGGVVDAIVESAAEISADLIVMATEGANGILDALRGSVTEQVLRRAPCPLLAVPAAR